MTDTEEMWSYIWFVNDKIKNLEDQLELVKKDSRNELNILKLRLGKVHKRMDEVKI